MNKLKPKASEDNKALLSAVYPLEVQAFNKYGRTAVFTLQGIINE